MMRRLPVSFVLVLILFGTARPADASMQDFLDWLQEMSGPGGFRGLGVEWRYMCYGVGLGIDHHSHQILNVPSNDTEPRLHPSSECDYLYKLRRQTYFGISASILTTSDSKYT